MKTFTAKEGYLYIKDGITAKEICLPDNENGWELISEGDALKVANKSELENQSFEIASEPIDDMIRFDEDIDTFE